MINLALLPPQQGLAGDLGDRQEPRAHRVQVGPGEDAAASVREHGSE